MTDLTLTEAAKVAGVSPRRLRHAVTTGKLRARTVGRAYVVDRADLDAWSPPAPGASLVAYWAAKKATQGGSGAESEAGTGACVKFPGFVFTSAEPTYAPAIIRCEAGHMPAEVIISAAGLPDEIVDFGVVKARWTGEKDGRGRFTFTEV